jgi:putative hemolysin
MRLTSINGPGLLKKSLRKIWSFCYNVIVYNFKIPRGIDMKSILITCAVMVLTACSTTTVKTNVPVNMANPASVYCHQSGGKLSVIDTASGKTGYCTLPSGELVEEWTLYKRDHPQK